MARYRQYCNQFAVSLVYLGEQNFKTKLANDSSHPPRSLLWSQALDLPSRLPRVPSSLQRWCSRTTKSVQRQSQSDVRDQERLSIFTPAQPCQCSQSRWSKAFHVCSALLGSIMPTRLDAPLDQRRYALPFCVNGKPKARIPSNSTQPALGLVPPPDPSWTAC
jgi:hypothetical protein